MPMTSQQFFHFIGAKMLPAIDAVVWKKFNQYPSQFKSLFNYKVSRRSIEQHTSLIGFGLATQITSEYAGVDFDQMIQGPSTTIEHSDFGLGFMVSHKIAREQKFGLLQKAARELASSIAYTREVQFMSMLNNAFDANKQTVDDGKALCASDHPLWKSAGATISNHHGAAAEISPDSLQLAMTNVWNTRDHTGKLIKVPYKKLVVANGANYFKAIEVLKSPGRMDTANHVDNAFKYVSVLDIVPVPHLTDPAAWFLMAEPENTELYVYDREAPYSDYTRDWDTRSYKEAMWYASSWKAVSWPGVYGVPSA